MLLTDREIKAIIEHSFRPFYCFVDMLDDGQIRFVVLRNHAQVYQDPGIALADVRKKPNLIGRLYKVRSYLEANGYQLDPW